MNLQQHIQATRKAARVRNKVKAARSKYGNKPQIVDGIRFASILEAKRYGELKLLQRANLITDLKIHSYWPLTVNGHHVCDYQDDFNYVEDGLRIIEDTKGVVTPDCRIKLALMKAVHGVDVKLVKARSR